MEKTKELHCNCCGKAVQIHQGIPVEEVMEIEWSWGYFSGKDGERHSFCLCEACYDRLREQFVLPVEVEEYL